MAEILGVKKAENLDAGEPYLAVRMLELRDHARGVACQAFLVHQRQDIDDALARLGSRVDHLLNQTIDKFIHIRRQQWMDFELACRAEEAIESSPRRDPHMRVGIRHCLHDHGCVPNDVLDGVVVEHRGERPDFGPTLLLFL